MLEDIQQEKDNLVGFKAKKPWELFVDRSVRWQVITIIVLNMAQQLNGVNAVCMSLLKNYLLRNLQKESFQKCPVSMSTTDVLLRRLFVPTSWNR